MLLPTDRIRFHLQGARAGDPDRRDGATVRLMADALIEERRRTGSATRGDLAGRYGFTSEEIARLGGAAVDRAVRRFVGGAMADPVAA